MSPTTTLFLYFTYHEQTRRICAAMAETLQATGMNCRLLPITAPEAAAALADCQQVVIGAPIRHGRLPRALYQFIAAHTGLLATRPNAFFCVSASARKAGRDTPEGSAYLRTFLKRSPWWPQRLTAFAGAIRYPRYRWHEKAIIRFIMLLTGGPTDTRHEHEFTDWAAVHRTAREWAAEWTVAPGCSPQACAGCPSAARQACGS